MFHRDLLKSSLTWVLCQYKDVVSAVDRLIFILHYHDVIMDPVASQITSLTIVYSIVYSDADERKHQSSASLAFVWGMNSPHKGPVTRKMFPFDDVITGNPHTWQATQSLYRNGALVLLKYFVPTPFTKRSHSQHSIVHITRGHRSLNLFDSRWHFCWNEYPQIDCIQFGIETAMFTEIVRWNIGIET